MNLTGAAPSQTDRPSPPDGWAYAWWAATGAVLSFGIVGLLTIGAYLLPVGLVLLVVGSLWAPLRNQSAIALVGGLAAAPLFLAWLNQQGPGRICETIEDVTACAERWSPWPFVAVALLLLVGAATAAVRARRNR